jgi:flagellar capping protein FliD
MSTTIEGTLQANIEDDDDSSDEEIEVFLEHSSNVENVISHQSVSSISTVTKESTESHEEPQLRLIAAMELAVKAIEEEHLTEAINLPIAETQVFTATVSPIKEPDTFGISYQPKKLLNTVLVNNVEGASMLGSGSFDDEFDVDDTNDSDTNVTAIVDALNRAKLKTVMEFSNVEEAETDAPLDLTTEKELSNSMVKPIDALPSSKPRKPVLADTIEEIDEEAMQLDELREQQYEESRERLVRSVQDEWEQVCSKPPETLSLYDGLDELEPFTFVSYTEALEYLQ